MQVPIANMKTVQLLTLTLALALMATRSTARPHPRRILLDECTTACHKGYTTVLQKCLARSKFGGVEEDRKAAQARCLDPRAAQLMQACINLCRSNWGQGTPTVEATPQGAAGPGSESSESSESEQPEP
jgi:hypothetical protein